MAESAEDGNVYGYSNGRRTRIMFDDVVDDDDDDVADVTDDGSLQSTVSTQLRHLGPSRTYNVTVDIDDGGDDDDDDVVVAMVLPTITAYGLPAGFFARTAAILTNNIGQCTRT